MLYISGHKVVDNNGCHAESERSGRRWLNAGRHKLVVDMCEVGGGEAFKMRYKGPDTGNRKITIPKRVLKHEKAWHCMARVVSKGMMCYLVPASVKPSRLS